MGGARERAFSKASADSGAFGASERKRQYSVAAFLLAPPLSYARASSYARSALVGSSLLACLRLFIASVLSPRIAACRPRSAKSRAWRRCASVGALAAGDGVQAGRCAATMTVRLSASTGLVACARAVNGASASAATMRLRTGVIYFTVTDAVPLFPSLVAVIVTVPFFTPVTTPVDETVAT